VFEAIGTRAADLDGDGRAEILVTQSDDSNGAVHLALALREGKLIRKAMGQAIGQGNRWSHLLGGFNLPSHGKRVLAIETPHLAGYLLALRLEGGQLSEQARRLGFTTHAIGSRNLWEHALMRRGGKSEVVLQEVGHGRLAALTLQKGGRWDVRWTIPLNGAVSSNLLTGDFNGDGRDDLAFSGDEGNIYLLLSN
jgi:hypothetical protein